MGRKKANIKESQRQAFWAERGKKKIVRHNTAANQEKHRNDWLPLTPNDVGVVADRRIMPRDELSRRLLLEGWSAQPITGDFDESRWSQTAAARGQPLGVVIEVSRGLCRVAYQEQVILCDLRGSLIAQGTAFTNIVAVGDRVLFSLREAGHGWVEEVLPRRSALARADPFYGHLKQIIAANVEQLLIVASWREPHLWLELIDEYLIAAERNNLAAVVCVNKMDLAADPAEARRLLRPYETLGHDLLLTSAVSGLGLHALREALRDTTTVLAGLSGVGKSSLLSAVEPGLQLRARPVSEKSGEGQHTTSQVNLLPLSGGGYVVDTPGIRDLGLPGLEPADLISFYADIEAAAAGCRFRDCAHGHEPGCAVRAAVAAGEVAEWRLQNFRKLHEQLQQG